MVDLYASRATCAELGEEVRRTRAEREDTAAELVATIAERDDLERRRSALARALHDSEAQREQESAAAARLRRELEARSRQCREAEAAASASSQRGAALEARCEELSADLAVAKGVVQRMTQECDGLRAALELASAARDELGHDLSVAKGVVQRLTADRDRLRVDVAELRELLEREERAGGVLRADLEAVRREMAEAVRSLHAAMASVTRQLDAAIAERDDALRVQRRTTQALHEANQNLAHVAARCVDLHTQVATLARDVARAHSNADDLGRAMVAERLRWAQEVQTLQQERDHLHEHLQGLRQDAQARAEQLEHENRLLAIGRQVLDDRVRELEADADAERQRAADLDAQLQAVRAFFESPASSRSSARSRRRAPDDPMLDAFLKRWGIRHRRATSLDPHANADDPEGHWAAALSDYSDD
jgi:chromosome segregation ATPase